MNAVGYKTPGPIERDDSLIDIDLPMPEATGHDILVKADRPSPAVGARAEADDLGRVSRSGVLSDDETSP